MGKEIKAEFKVTTPMFMSGHDQQKAEFRIPSLLGALRFWYRATAPADLLYNISKLREAEEKLFGSTGTGQAAFLVRTDTSGKVTADASTLETRNRYGVTYLGYGPISYRGAQRSYIKGESLIKIRFIFRPVVKEQKPPDQEGFKRALKAFILFGGLGSRSRHGFGSVTLLTLKDEDGNHFWRAPRNKEELQTEISSFINALALKDKTKEPSYTAFSSESRIIISKTKMDPLNLLDEIGREMIRYRSYGRNVNGKYTLPGQMGKAEQFFKSDHDLILRNLHNNKKEHPQRVEFGLPHNYRFSHGLEVKIRGTASDRRASPLFIHVHELDRQYAAVLSYIPAQFLPDNETIKISGNGAIVEVPVKIEGLVIRNFLDRIPGALEVKL